MARAAAEVSAAGAGPLAAELGMAHLPDLGDLRDLPTPDEEPAEAAREAAEAAAARGEAEAADLEAAERAAGALRQAEADLAEAEARAKALAREASSAGGQVEELRQQVGAAREASREAEEEARAARGGRLVEAVAEVEEAASSFAPEAGALNGTETPAPEPGSLNGAEAPGSEASVNGAEPAAVALPLDDSGWRQELRIWLPDDPEPAEGPADLPPASVPAAAADPSPPPPPPPPPLLKVQPSEAAVEFTLATPSTSGAPASALAVTVASDPPVLELACDAAADVTLHWAVAKEQGGRWRRVPRGWKTLPDFSIDAGGNAWETAFMRVPPALQGDGPAQTMRLELAAGGLSKVGGVVFVLKLGDAGAYLNNGGDDFFVPLAAH
jgi:hypothetical protein